MRHKRAEIFKRDCVAENEAEVRAALRKWLARHGATKEMAALLGVSEPYISIVHHGSGPVPPKVAAVLGYRRVVRWKKGAR